MLPSRPLGGWMMSARAYLRSTGRYSDGWQTVAEPMSSDGRIAAGTLPAGRYATLRHTGHPSTLVEATRLLLEWAAERTLAWDVAPSPDGDRWAARVELYLTDPQTEPDMNKWMTELAFRLADRQA